MSQQKNQLGEGSDVATLILIALVITVLLELTATPVLRLFGASDQTLP